MLARKLNITTSKAGVLWIERNKYIRAPDRLLLIKPPLAYANGEFRILLPHLQHKGTEPIAYREHDSPLVGITRHLNKLKQPHDAQ